MERERYRGIVKIRNKLIGITAIVIVMLFIGMSAQPVVETNANVRISAYSHPYEEIFHNVRTHGNSINAAKSVMKTNSFTAIYRANEIINPEMSFHYTYYTSPLNHGKNFAMKSTVYYYGRVISSTFVSDIKGDVSILSLQSVTPMGNPSPSMNSHSDNINPGQLLSWIDETGPNGGFILSFNNANTGKLIDYLFGVTAIEGGLTTLVRSAAPVLAAALDISASALVSTFVVVFAVMAITAGIFSIINAAGGYQGIYFGVGINIVNLLFTSVSVPYPLLNSNPAPGFIPIAVQSI